MVQMLESEDWKGLFFAWEFVSYDLRNYSNCRELPWFLTLYNYYIYTHLWNCHDGAISHYA